MCGVQWYTSKLLNLDPVNGSRPSSHVRFKRFLAHQFEARSPSNVDLSPQSALD